jgi:exodeoxyribonuclease VII large subunit
MIAGRTDVRVVSVARLATYITKLFEKEPAFTRLGVRGEITNYKPQANGNVYFDLKDDGALLNCVAFKEAAATFPVLASGDAVVAYGTVTTFKPRSSYQLRVFDVVPQGASGALHARYEALKARLSAEGLFDAARRRPLPRYPFCVALVTSKTAEGARDFYTQARARAPHVTIRLIDTPVQGPNAAPDIARAIVRAGAMPGVDLIVLARGGGSFEDLFAFSDERVVRALAASPLPTVSAIGHEADAPLTDFVADLRAATPSAAAQTVLPRRDDLLTLLENRRRIIARDVDRAITTRRQHVDTVGRRLEAAARQRVSAVRERLVRVERRLARIAPAARLAQRRARFDAYRQRLLQVMPERMRRRTDAVRTLVARLNRANPAVRVARARAGCTAASARLDAAMARLIERHRAVLREQSAKLEGNNPDAILQRGYAIVTDEMGHTLRDAADAPAGSRIVARLARGRLAARVEPEGTDGGRQIGLF